MSNGKRGGQPGNQNASKARKWEEAINRAGARRFGTVEAAYDEAADHLWLAVVAGEQWAIRELGDRADGKPAQAMTLSGDPDAPLKVHKVVCPD